MSAKKRSAFRPSDHGPRHDPQHAVQLPETGFLRLSQIIGSRKTNPPTPPIIPVGRTTWLEGVKAKIYPSPVRGLGRRITVWKVEDIRALIVSVGAGESSEDTNHG